MKKKINILIIDDVMENIQVAMNILKKAGYDFFFATDGTEALALLKQENGPVKIDLILLDIMMPGMDGFEVCRQVKENSQIRDIPIIFLSAKVEVESISQGFSLGGVDYITKPFHADELLARVKTHVQLYHAKKLLQEHNIELESNIKYQQQRFLTALENNQKEIIYLLTEFMESSSEETGKHIRRVAELSSLLAHYHPGMSAEDEGKLYHASPMHDIGKMTIPHDILHKPGQYTEEEFETMKAHAVNAYQLLKRSDCELLKASATIAHEHHEKWDGKGYPQQLRGSDIHIYGRIVALADVFDALTHKRCYKDAWSMEKVIGYIQEQRGTHFDPELVDIMMEHMDGFQAIVETNQ